MRRILELRPQFSKAFRQSVVDRDVDVVRLTKPLHRRDLVGIHPEDVQ